MSRLRFRARGRVSPTLALAVLMVAALAVTGCAADVGSTGDKGYVDGKGVITVLPAGKRKQPGEVSGETLEGKQVSLSSYAGKVVVINVWGAWCPPCRAEADDLAAAARVLAPDGVVFLGINSRDLSKDNALAFQRTYKVPYASIYDPGGRNLLAFRGTLTPNSIPSTVIIDKQGRVAASILGELSSKTTLVDLVEDVSK
jgi:thiol-disulfide isomerase/thioredoxin